MKKHPFEGMTEEQKFHWQQNEIVKMKAIGFLIVVGLFALFCIYAFIRLNYFS